jgi:two-component system, probable response regulator PhcQ
VGKHTILIVDDEHNILNSLSRLLKSDDCEIITADSAEDGLKKLKDAGGVDLIISDNCLPNTSGLDFLIKARHLYPDVVRMLITGYPDLESTIQAINKGQVYRFITKPWENDELKLIVKQALEYFDVLRDNRTLLNIARQQAEGLKVMQQRYPSVSPKDFNKSGMYIIDEKKVSETLSDFMKKYYPQGNKE